MTARSPAAVGARAAARGADSRRRRARPRAGVHGSGALREAATAARSPTVSAAARAVDRHHRRRDPTGAAMTLVPRRRARPRRAAGLRRRARRRRSSAPGSLRLDRRAHFQLTRRRRPDRGAGVLIAPRASSARPDRGFSSCLAGQSGSSQRMGRCPTRFCFGSRTAESSTKRLLQQTIRRLELAVDVSSPVGLPRRSTTYPSLTAPMTSIQRLLILVEE